MTPDLVSLPDDGGTEPGATERPGVCRRPVPRGVTVSMLSAMSIVIVLESQMFWREWQAMRQEVEAVGVSAPIGFHNVYSNPSRAVRPKNWFRPEGDSLFLWAGWEGNQHHWFKASRNDLERPRLSDPISRDVIRSVNDPWVEVGGGSIWERMPAGTLVVGQSLAGVPTAYPMRLLTVMSVVNDLVKDTPYLALFSHRHPREQPIGIFDSRVGGDRVTLGTSGYLLDGNLLLYDHETESLWMEDGDSVCAVSGRHKGNRLPLVARPFAVTWSDWKARNPRSRLLVGTHETPVWSPRSASTASPGRGRPSL